jgi:hypothetical protein
MSADAAWRRNNAGYDQQSPWSSVEFACPGVRGTSEYVIVGATMTLQDGMRERRRSEWYDRGGWSSFFQRKMRPAARSRFAGPSGNLVGRAFARSLTKQTRKASSHPGCCKIGLSQRCTPWHRSPSCDLRRAPCDHPDFTSNALHEDVFGGSPN